MVLPAKDIERYVRVRPQLHAHRRAMNWSFRYMLTILHCGDSTMLPLFLSDLGQRDIVDNGAHDWLACLLEELSEPRENRIGPPPLTPDTLGRILDILEPALLIDRPNFGKSECNDRPALEML